MLEHNPHVVIFTDVTTEGFGRYAGPYKIASELRQHGFVVQVIEYFTAWTTRDLKVIIKKFVTQNTLWVGVSTTFLAPRDNSMADYTKLDLLRNRDSSFYDKFNVFPYHVVVGRNDWPEIADFIRTINENCKLVMGGHRVNFSRDTKDPYIDYIISGEGEASALFLSLELQKDKTLPKNLSEPYNGYSHSVLRYEDNDLIFKKEHLPIEIARGCIFKCAFCSYPLTGKKLWEFNRNPHLVREEIELAYEKFGSTGFMFCDDTYIDSRKNEFPLDIDNLTAVPHSDAVYSIDAGIVEKGNVIVQVFEISTTYATVFTGLDAKNRSYELDNLLKVGAMGEASLNGNWGE